MPKLSLSQTAVDLNRLEKSMKAEKGQNKVSYSLTESVTTELIKLQERQTELSAAIAYHQRINTLLVQEPTTLSRDSMDYPRRDRDSSPHRGQLSGHKTL